MSSAREENKGVEALKNFERALGHVRNSVRPLTLVSREEVGTCVSAADRAKLNLQVAYGVSSLFYMFLKTQGIPPAGHPVKAELGRIRGYFGRLKQVGKPPEKRTMKVDADASRRFINAALSGDNVWQNAKSTDPASARQKRAAAGIGRSGPSGAPEDDTENTHNEAAAPAAAPAAGAGTLAGSAAAGDAAERKQRLPGSRSSSKRKHEAAAAAAAAADAADGWVSVAKGGARGKRRSGGGGGVGGGSAAAAPEWGDRPQAAVPGESPGAAKKAKGTTTGGKANKKPPRYHSW